MQRFLLFLVFMLVSIFCAPLHAQGWTAEDAAHLDSMMTDKYPPNGPGGVLLVARDGVPVYQKGFGLASLELRVPNHPGNVYKIASNTKQFTAVAVLQLAAAGKVDLAADFRDYLPGFRGDDRKISVARLLNHTSGIPSNGQLPSMSALEEAGLGGDSIVRYLGEQTLLFAPGSDFSYSNNAFDLAGLLVEAVSGQSLTDYFQEHIFDPLGMTDTYTTAREKVIPGRATGYEGTAKSGYEFIREERVDDWSIGSGFISSTVTDLLRWNNGLRSGKVLPPEWLARAWTPARLKDGTSVEYNAGWTINRVGDHRLITHGGALRGFLSYTISAPDDGYYVAILTNYRGGKRPTYLAREAILRALDVDPPADQPVALDTQRLNDYVGSYTVHRLGSRRMNSDASDILMSRYLSLRNDTLFQRVDYGEPQALVPLGNDDFRDPKSEVRYHFERDATGTVSGITLSNDIIRYGNPAYELRRTAELPAEPEGITLSAADREALVGIYRGDPYLPGLRLTATSDGGLTFRYEGTTPEPVIVLSRDRLILTDLGVAARVRWRGKEVVGIDLEDFGSLWPIERARK